MEREAANDIRIFDRRVDASGRFRSAFAQQTQFPTDPNKAKGQTTEPGKK